MEHLPVLGSVLLEVPACGNVIIFNYLKFPFVYFAKEAVLAPYFHIPHFVIPPCTVAAIEEAKHWHGQLYYVLEHVYEREMFHQYSTIHIFICSRSLPQCLHISHITSCVSRTLRQAFRLHCRLHDKKKPLTRMYVLIEHVSMSSIIQSDWLLLRFKWLRNSVKIRKTRITTNQSWSIHLLFCGWTMMFSIILISLDK